MHSLRVFAASIVIGLRDFRRVYAVKTWLFGYFARNVLEVAFYACIGVFLQSTELALFLAVGRAAFLGPQEALFAIQSSTWERKAGTLQLLLASPSTLWPVFSGRGLQWIISGALSSALALTLVAFAFWGALDPLGVVVAVAMTPLAAIGSYGFAIPLSALVLLAPSLRNFVSNFTHSLIALFCGVVVPISAWPSAIEVLANLVPVTHALAGARAALSGDILAAIGPSALSVVIGAIYFALGALAIESIRPRLRRGGLSSLLD